MNVAAEACPDQTPCPLCGGDRFHAWLTGVPRLGSHIATRFNIERCAACGLLQTRPQPTADELRAAYGSAYTWQQSGGLVARAEAWYRRMLVRCDQVRSLGLAARLANGRRTLDLGCGDGLLITEARRNGLEAFGIDRPDAPLWPGCAPAWRIAGDIERIDQPPESWDVVSLFHVIEHLREPLPLLQKVHAWLRPRGVLLLQLPNAASLQARLLRHRWYGFDMPRHLVHWTPDTLGRALTQSGYTVITTRYMSWRDSSPALIASLVPDFDPLVERERLLATGSKRGALGLTLRRLTFLTLVWSAAPLCILEAVVLRGAVITVLARKGP